MTDQPSGAGTAAELGRRRGRVGFRRRPPSVRGVRPRRRRRAGRGPGRPARTGPPGARRGGSARVRATVRRARPSTVSSRQDRMSGPPSATGSPRFSRVRCTRARSGGCWSRSNGSGSSSRSRLPTTWTSTHPSITRPTSARCSVRTPSRSPRTGATCRSGTTGGRERSSCPAPRWSARPVNARRQPTPSRRSVPVGVSTSRPNWASWSACRPAKAIGSRPMPSATMCSGSCSSTTGRPAISKPGSTYRSGRSSASLSPPRSPNGSPRSPRWTRPRTPLPDQVPAPLEYLRVSGDAGYDLTYEIVAQRRGGLPAALRDDVLVARPDARAPHRQRRVVAHRRPVRVGHRVGPAARPARLAARAELGWAGAVDVGGAQRTFLEDGDEVTLRATARGRIGRIALGEVTGRILPAR